jgi:hypothetical protein
MNVPAVLRRALLPAALALSFASLPAMAQQTVNIRGMLSAFDGKVLSVKARDGRDVQIDLPADLAVSATGPFSLADVKPGMVLGVTTVKRDGATVAIDVRPIPPAARQGLTPYDLQPESTMTNAVFEAAVSATGGQEITLKHPGGDVKVLVPPGTPMSRAIPGTRDDLKVGEAIYVATQQGEGDRLRAVRVQVGKGGLRPTQ